MHEFDAAALTPQQQALATTANAISLQIQEQLKQLVSRERGVVNPADVEARLAPYLNRLAQAESVLWEHARQHVSTAEANAAAIAIILANPPADAVASLGACVARVTTALRGMTSVQRQVMRLNPLIALAENIAFDMEAEFDNDEALARWTKQARDHAAIAR